MVTSKKKRAIVEWIALINCLVAICALLVKDVTVNQVVVRLCKWVLLVAWLIQGAYILFRFRKK